MFVVTLPASAKAYPQRFAQKAKEAGADILEIRGDLTPHIESFISPLPILLAVRGASAELIMQLRPAYLDLELGEDVGLFKGIALIRSYHHYERTPSLSELKDIADQLMAHGGEIIKIATKINTYEDLLIHKQLRESLPAGQQSIILGMGDKAHLSRMLSPFQNMFTYTYFEESDKAAPGQIALSMYKKTVHCSRPSVYGLIGGMQSKSSLSPLIHNTLMERHDLDAVYSLFPTDDIEDAFNNLSARCAGIFNHRAVEDANGGADEKTGRHGRSHSFNQYGCAPWGRLGRVEYRFLRHVARLSVSA